MKTVLAALGGIVCGFVLGELITVAVGVTAELVLDASMPLALKLLPFHLAVVGAVAGPFLLRRGRGGAR
ncbi:DUF5957 family protein [Streptomyces macrosporus]|uniref:Uncharacterized protein n=1 Tax=Streptomyces macrosporus TaxID=44032 RepID=A0ABN3JGM8_9ACTN